MKIRNEDIQHVAQEPIRLFYQGMRAAATKEKYTRTLKAILCDTFEDVLECTLCAYHDSCKKIISFLISN